MGCIVTDALLGLAYSLCIYLICLFVCSNPLIIPSRLLVPYAPFSKLNSEEYQNIAQGGGLHTKVPAHRDSRQTINSVFFALEFGVIWLFSDLPSIIQILDFETFLNMGPTPKYGNTVKFTFLFHKFNAEYLTCQPNLKKRFFLKNFSKNSKKIKITKLNQFNSY